MGFCVCLSFCETFHLFHTSNMTAELNTDLWHGLGEGMKSVLTLEKEQLSFGWHQVVLRGSMESH